jgi:predicted DCC family thiol-disulfide oxidoreductase YuxK
VETTSAPTARPVPWVVFDGDCGFCTSSAQWVAARLDRPGRPTARLVPWQRTDLAALGTDADRAQREVLWVAPDGAVAGGAEAFACWLRFAGQPYAALSAVMGAPLVRQLAAAVYRLVARNRQRLPGGTPACALPAPADRPTIPDAPEPRPEAL